MSVGAVKPLGRPSYWFDAFVLLYSRNYKSMALEIVAYVCRSFMSGGWDFDVKTLP